MAAGICLLTGSGEVWSAVVDKDPARHSYSRNKVTGSCPALTIRSVCQFSVGTPPLVHPPPLSLVLVPRLSWRGRRVQLARTSPQNKMLVDVATRRRAVLRGGIRQHRISQRGVSHPGAVLRSEERRVGKECGDR